jgi:glycosyltransferase involved in cell wall biosynthesis
MPDISVVVPAYNAGQFLARTIQSVCAQSLSNWELLVIDDGSTDDTSVIAGEFVARDPRITYRYQNNAGVAAARNAGLCAADRRAWAILFLDADDVLEPDALEVLNATLQARPEALGAHGLVRFVDTQDRPIRPGEAETWGRERRALVHGRIVEWPVEQPTTLAVLVLLNRMRSPGCLLLRRAVVESVGGFDTDPKSAIAEDYGLWLRLACEGYFILVDKIVLSYRVHALNASGNINKMNVARWYVHKKLAHADYVSEEQRQLIKQGLRYSRLLGSKNWSTWAVNSLKEGHLLSAANQARHALIELLHFYFDRAESAA